MKNEVLFVALVGLFGVLIGCKPANRVIFRPALISFDPGQNWRRIEIPTNSTSCSPQLLRSDEMINVILLGSFTDIQRVADMVQTSYTPQALPYSFKQEGFSTDTGLSGIHLSYTGWTTNGGTPDIRSHDFIIHNRSGVCVRVSYITSPDVESAAVLEAIRKTMKVE